MLMAEMLLTKKLLSLGAALKTVWEGDTRRSERMPKVRLEALKFRDVTFTVKDGKNVTIEQQFWNAYGESLEP